MAGFNRFEPYFQEPILRGMAEITVRSDLVWDVWRGGKIGFKIDLPLLKEFWRETWSTRFFDLRSGRILGSLALREQNTRKKHDFCDLTWNYSGVWWNFGLVKLDLGDVRLSWKGYQSKGLWSENLFMTFPDLGNLISRSFRVENFARAGGLHS